MLLEQPPEHLVEVRIVVSELDAGLIREALEAAPDDAAGEVGAERSVARLVAFDPDTNLRPARKVLAQAHTAAGVRKVHSRRGVQDGAAAARIPDLEPAGDACAE